MIGTNRYIGSPIERIEDLRFLRGRGQSVGDLKREGMLHAAILRSPVAHGLVAGVDASAALAIAGVCTVITAKDIGAVPRIPRIKQWSQISCLQKNALKGSACCA